MGDPNRDAADTLARFEQMFQTIAEAMKRAATAADHSIASGEVERFDMVKTEPTKPIGDAWRKAENGYTLWFQWRYYDQSKPFSIQKDMNIMSLELREGSKVLREVEERFED
jgi:hypothetical protein